MTARYFVAGWPVAHSRSPGMHNAAFKAAGMDAVYGRLEVAPGAFAEAMASDGPYLVEAMIDTWELVLPMLPNGGTVKDLITEKEQKKA